MIFFKSMKKVLYAKLPTEKQNPRSKNIDRISINKIITIIHQDDHLVPKAVGKVRGQIAKAVKLIVASLKSGGKLYFVGAGTSGRLGVLEAAECPPTFNTPPSLVQAVIAGGKRTVFRSSEGAEDNGAEGARQIRRRVRPGDMVVGIAASGVTPFVRAALQAARKRGAATALVTCNPDVPASAARVVIALAVGPE